MPQHTPLYIVASQHPRVGKTLMARLLIEYFRLSGRPLVGYDLDPREPALARLFPKLGLDRRYRRYPRPDGAVRPAGRRRLADHRHRSRLRPVRAVLRGDGGDRLRAGGAAAWHRPDRAVRHRLGADHRAQLCRAAARACRERLFVPVHNEATSFMFVPQDFPPTRPECGVIRIPRLSPIVRGVIDRPGFSFSAYHRQAARRPDRSAYLDRQHLFANFASSNCGF